MPVPRKTGKNAGTTQKSEHLFLDGQIRTFSDISASDESAQPFGQQGLADRHVGAFPEIIQPFFSPIHSTAMAYVELSASGVNGLQPLILGSGINLQPRARTADSLLTAAERCNTSPPFILYLRTQ
jgi:hypothetical protein